MLAVSSSPAASILAKATVIAALGLLATLVARRSRAAVRHALLAALFAVLLVLPIASLVAPPVRIALPAAEERTGQGFSGPVALDLPAAPAQLSAGSASPVPPPAGLSPSTLWLAGWIAGTVLFLLPVVMGLWQVRRLRRAALPWEKGHGAAERLALEAGIHRRVAVLLHEALPGPMTCGVIHPAIVLPREAQTWEAEDLHRALVHELEHVRRGDWLSQCLARAMCAIYWFHPLVWMAWRRFALEAERSCDDAVLGHSEATAYADQLVGLARRLSAAAKFPALAMANRADLAARIGAVLDSRQRRGRAGTLPVALACAAAAALILTVSPLRMVAAIQANSTAASPVQAVAAPQAASAAASPLRTVAAPQSSVAAPVAPMPQFRFTTSLVVVDAFVLDKNGKTVEGLGAEDFVLTEDGKPQNISVFEFQKLTMDGVPQGPQPPVSSYYILGFYTTNQNMDGTYRRIKLSSKADTVAKLDFRAGYYANKPFGGAGPGPDGAAPGTPSDATRPVLLLVKEPEYSEAARKAKHQGTVVLHVEVDESGQATNLKVLRSLGLGLDEKALEAVQQWKFQPGMKDGKPVAVQAQVVVDFRLL
jgi:TonB family protein